MFNDHGCGYPVFGQINHKLNHMDLGYLPIIGLLVVGIAYGLLKKKRAGERKSNSGWGGLLILAVPLTGLHVAGAMGSEKLTWFFGIALMVALPLLFFFAIGSAIGGAFNRDKNGSK